MLRSLTLNLCFAPALLFAVACAHADPPLPSEAIARVGSTRMRQGELVSGMAFMPDGRTLVSIGPSGRMRFWDTGTGDLRRQVQVAGPQPLLNPFWFHLAVADDASTIGLGGFGGYVLLDAEGKQVKTYDAGPNVGPGGAIGIVSIATSRDGKTVCTVHRDRKVSLRDSRTGEERINFRADTKNERMFFGDCSFMPDAKSVAVVNMYARAIGVYDTATGKAYHTFENIPEMVRVVLISPDGGTMATISYRDESVTLFDLATGKVRHHVKDVTLEPACMRFSPDGKTLAVGGSGPSVALVDAVKGTVVRRFAWPANNVVRVAFSPDGKALAAASTDGAMVLWNVATGERLPVSADPIVSFHRLRFVGGGKRLLTFSDAITFWDWPSGRVALRYPLPTSLNLNATSVTRCWACVSPNGKTVAHSLESGAVVLTDMKTGEKQQELPGNSPWGLGAIVFSPDGKTLFFGGDNAVINVWDLASGKRRLQLIGHTSHVSNLAVSSDGRLLASACGDASAEGNYAVRVWDTATGEELRKLEPRRGSAFAFAFSPDNAQLAIVGGEPGQPNKTGEVSIWDIATAKEVRAFEGHTERVTCVAYSPDGRMLATGSLDNTLRLWDVATRRQRHRFAGNEGRVMSVDFSPDGRLLAAAGPAGPALIWDVYGNFAQKPAGPRWSAAERDAHFRLLAEPDAEKTFAVMRGLIARPAESAELLRERLKPIPKEDATKVDQWLKDLSDMRFAVRQRAATELEKRASALEARLQREAAETKSAEAKQRLNTILARLDKLAPEDLQRMRAVEVLERTGGPEALRLLEELAKGEPNARFTRQAKEATERLRNR